MSRLLTTLLGGDNGTYAGPGVIDTQFDGAVATWPVANWAYGSRITVPVSKIYRYGLFYVGVSSGNVQFSVCALSGASAATFTRVMTSGVIACPTTGAVRLDLGATLLPAGEYALALWADNTTFTTHRANNTVGNTFRQTGRVNAGAGGLPASGAFSAWDQSVVLGLGLEADV